MLSYKIIINAMAFHAFISNLIYKDKCYMVEYSFSEELKKYLEGQRKKVADNPNNAVVLVEVGSHMFTTEYFKGEARSYLEEAVKIDPTNIDARFWLAMSLYYNFCDYEQAREILYQTIKLAPTRADCLSLLGYTIKGIEGPTDECIGYLKSAIKFESDWILPRQALIQFYMRKKDLNLAEKEIKALSAIMESLKSRLIRISSSTQEYYERCVTGRIPSEYNVQFLQEQIKELNKAKLGNLSNN